MSKTSLKSFLASLFFVMLITSFSFAGDGHCPVVPPPPPGEGGRNSVQVIADDNSAEEIIKSLWEFIAQNSLF